MNKKNQFITAQIENACEKNYEPHFFEFFDLGQQNALKPVLNRQDEPFLFYGGVENTERKMLCIYPEYVDQNDLEWPIEALFFKNDFEDVDHRNILGTLMQLGIERKVIGDIFVTDDCIEIIYQKHLRSFLLLNFTKINRHRITPEVLSLNEIRYYPPKVKTLHIVAASERADGIINKIFGFSRSESITCITQHRLRVNDEVVSKKDFRLHEGDILSLRGKGKARIKEMGGLTKKGHLKLTVDKYI